MQNHFDLFGLPVGFDIDAAKLDAAYRDVQGKVHPDRFVNASDAEKRVAMQWATRANEAYQTLKSPHKRAAYLCELHGAPLQVESNTAMPGAFLMQQMEWREALADARAAKDVDAIERLEEEVRQARKTQMDGIAVLLRDSLFFQAAEGVRALMFIDKFIDELEASLDLLQ
jgi:molecular chaperone HscB